MTLDHVNGADMIVVPSSDVSVVDEEGMLFMRLKAAEEQIAMGLLEIGFALRQIKLEQLYVARGYNNFTAYCEHELSYSRPQALRLMNAAETSIGLNHMYMPKNERQFRALRAYPVHMRPTIMRKAMTFAMRQDKRLTHSIIDSVGQVEVQLETTAPEMAGEQVEVYDGLVAYQTQQRQLDRMREGSEQVYSNVALETIVPLLAKAATINWLFALFSIAPTEIKVSAYMRISE